ncbi:MAG: hypothetical protein WCY89_08300 [Flavobacteriaceae bacterium]
MKKLVMMMALVVGVTAFAQDKKADKRERFSAEERVEKMAKELDLNQEQKQKLTALFEKQKEEAQKKRAAIKAERAERREALSSRSEAFDKEVKSILTPEQAKKWEAKKQERMKHKREDFKDAKHPSLKRETKK